MEWIICQHNEPALPLEEIQAVPGHYRIKKRQLGIEQDDEQTVAKFITSSSPKRLKFNKNKNKNNNLSNQILPSNDNNESPNQQRIRSVIAESKLSKVDELKSLDINNLSDEMLLELVEKRKLLTNITSNKTITSRESSVDDTRRRLFTNGF